MSPMIPSGHRLHAPRDRFVRVGGFAFRLTAIGACAIALCLAATTANAAVQTQLLDDIFPLDNPFTPSIDEGLPDNGNSINPAKGMTAAAQGDPRTNYGPVPVDYAVPYFESRLNVIVGRTQTGTLVINGGSDLRYEDLIIGGYDPSDATTIPTVFTRGSGTVRIEGTGSLYNNNYLLLPPPIADGNPFGINWGTSIRQADAGADGFDMYVGRQYDGVLSLTLGGRAEIQDAVVVGDGGATTGGTTSQFNSSGRIDVDGFESTLLSGGFEATIGDNLPHQMIIGRLGTGEMNITNGGRVISLGPILQTGQLIVGAVLGGDPFEVNQAPSQGGKGTVKVDGQGSTWTVGGSLQIGGFHDVNDLTGTMTTEQDLEGNDVDYTATGKINTVTVQNGGLVNIISPISDPDVQAPNRLDVVIGWEGRLMLNGGTVQSLGVLRQTQPGTNPIQQVAQGRLINDGEIHGTGTIDTLQFRNRVLGEVIVNAGEKLAVSASGDFLLPQEVIIPTNDQPDYPLSNYGLIQVTGTDTARAEIEFNRQIGPSDPSDPLQIRPFLNVPITVGPSGQNGRTGGEIIGQDSVMRFKTGIINSNKVSFTGGTNLVTGNFTNDGTVFVGGSGTTVTFVDQFFNNGTLQLEPNISLVMFIDDVLLGGAGTLSTSFGGRPTGQEISMLSSAENIVLGGTLNASLFTSPPGVPGFTPQPGDQFEIINSATGLFGDFTTVNLPGCINGDICFVGFPDYTLDSYFIRTFSIAGALGADFDGSGIVDDLDRAIWEQNVGGPGPVGDANGDGIVNGADLFIWFMQNGGPGMAVPGGGGIATGSGGLAGSNAVPEPASMILLVAGALLALAGRRGRHA